VTETSPAPLSNSDLPIFFDAHHQTLAAHLDTVGQALLADEALEHDAAYIAEVARRMGDEFQLYQWLTPSDGIIDVRALCLIRECLGFASPLADAIFAVQGLGTHPVLNAGTEAQQAEILPRIRSGEAISGFALTEPGAGSDVAAISTSAVRDGDSYVLNGEKTFISNVGIASHFVVFVRTDPDAGHRGLSAFIVEANSANLSMPIIPMSVDHPIGKLVFSDCKIPASNLLGDLGAGFGLAMQTLDTFRVSVGAAAVGMARRALLCAKNHVQQRIQFGKPLSSQQTVQAYLADMATELDASRLLVLRAAHAKDTGEGRASREVAMAKMYATEAAHRIIDQAVQLLGGLGVTTGQVVERLYREIRPLRIYEGTTEIQRLIIAKSLLKS
jgi:acyl-CoA dehydrogenase